MSTHPWGGEALSPVQLKAALRIWRLIEPAVKDSHSYGQRGAIAQLRHHNPALPSAATIRRWLVEYHWKGLAGLTDSRTSRFSIDQGTADGAMFFIKAHLLNDPEWLAWLAGVLPRGNGRKLTVRQVRHLLAHIQLHADE